MPTGPGRIRTRDPLPRRSFHAGDQPAVFLVRAGLIIVWPQLDVSVSASSWHATGTLLAVWEVLASR